MIPPILIAGIGNLLLQDDGLGPQAVARLQAEYEFGEEVELLDIGTPSLDFVDYLQGRRVLVLLDALSSGGEPGEILTFDKVQLKTHLPDMRLSAHQPTLHETLHTADAAEIDLQEILLAGIVGHSYDVGTQLGPYVAASLPELMELVVEFIRKHGVKVERRATPLDIAAWWQAEEPMLA